MEEQNKKESNPAKLRQPKEKKELVEQLKKVPIIQIACERVGISRPTFYRWKADDEDFAKEIKDALSEGIVFINELSESQVIALIKEKNLPAVRFWLRHNHPKYAQRIEITTKEPQEKLDPEQEAVVKEALRLAGITPAEEKMADDKNIQVNVQKENGISEKLPNEQSAEGGATTKSNSGVEPGNTTDKPTNPTT